MAVLLAIASLGSAPKLKPLKPEPIAILPAEEVWSARFDAPPATEAWMDDERVYVPLEQRGIRVLSRETGAPVWNEAVDLAHPVLGEDGHLLLPLPSELRAVDPATGQLRWTHPLESRLSTPLTAADGLVFLVDEAGDVTALRARDASTVWRRNLGSTTRHRPARAGETAIILTLEDSRVLALDTRTGETLWERKLTGKLSAAGVGRDRVLVGSDDNFFYALDAESGAERWKWRTGGDVIGAAAANDRVYFASLDGLLRAVNRSNGNQLWKVALTSRPSSPPIAFDDVVVVAGIAPRVDAFNGRTGASLGSYTAPTDLQGAPVIDTTPEPFKVSVVALTRDGRLSAMRSIGLMFPDPPLVPLLRLPGRELPRESRPGAVRLP